MLRAVRQAAEFRCSALCTSQALAEHGHFAVVFSRRVASTSLNSQIWALVRYTPCVEQGSKIEGFPFWTREPEAGRKDGNGEVSIAR
jgi:hypothetical protein